jgi:hypothetical protein
MRARRHVTVFVALHLDFGFFALDASRRDRR